MTKKNKPTSILFIGNSFSYYHCLPKLLTNFARASACDTPVVDGVFRGGATLKMLWNDGRALKKIHSKTWDYVVLQERGRLGGSIKDGVVHVGKPKEFFAYARQFDKAIKKIKAKTILYCPPSFLGVGLSGDAQKLNAAYTALARKLGALLIPSGAVFALALKKRPDLNLYEADGQHPNPLGTYLIASLFYKKLFHKKVFNLPLESYASRAQRLPKNPKRTKLSKTDAQFLWSIANRVK
ncbi:MAG: SGNH/GDSL hydrolase family protein [Candidatus Harrisonbacteria bacterium]|nr:SGNH/GDSL hydrolase family protein [Candidatus Harrisonbacteria bacterium]